MIQSSRRWRASQRPSVLRLVRLKRLQLLINDRLRAFVEVSAIRRASRPRLPLNMRRMQLA